MPDRKIAERPSSNFDASDERTNYKPPVTSPLYLYTVYRMCRLNVQGRWWIIDWKLQGTDYRAPRSLISVPSWQFTRIVLHHTGDIKTRNSVAHIMQDVLYLEKLEGIPKGYSEIKRVTELLNENKIFMSYGFSARDELQNLSVIT